MSDKDYEEPWSTAPFDGTDYENVKHKRYDPSKTAAIANELQAVGQDIARKRRREVARWRCGYCRKMNLGEFEECQGCSAPWESRVLSSVERAKLGHEDIHVR